MSSSFWTIFVITWVFGPFVLWVSVLGAVHCYRRITLSMMLREATEHCRRICDVIPTPAELQRRTTARR